MDITIFFIYIAVYVIFLLISLWKIPLLGIFNLLFLFFLIGFDNTVTETLSVSSSTTTITILDFQHFVVLIAFLLTIQFVILIYKLKFA